MKDSLDILKNDDYVEHYGVLGMKWGHRKQRYTGEALTNRLIEIDRSRKKDISKNRDVRRIKKFNNIYFELENPSKRKTNKWEKLKNKAIWASGKISKKYDKQERKVFENAKKTVSKEQLEKLNKAKEDFSKIWRERAATTPMRDIRKEDRGKYEKARQNLIDAMNDVTMDIVKGSSYSGWGAMKVTNYLLNEKDDSKNDRYGLNVAFDWDIEKHKLKKRK